MKADFYETLGVSKGADEKELKSAYRKLAMQFIPTAIRATMARRRSSRKSVKPMSA